MSFDGDGVSADGVRGRHCAERDGISDVEVLLANREFLYLYVARAFAAVPDNVFFDILQSSDAASGCLLLDDEVDEAGAGSGLQASIVGAMQCGESLDTLNSEYTALFIGPATPPAPPWESVFVSHDALLFQESTLTVREAYLDEGFRAAGYPHEPDDHIATELDFMAALANRALHACESGDIELCRKTLISQSRFLEEHLLVWVREFSDRLNEVDGISSFYPSFASLAALVCERDAEIIEELLAAM